MVEWRPRQGVADTERDNPLEFLSLLHWLRTDREDVIPVAPTSFQGSFDPQALFSPRKIYLEPQAQVSQNQTGFVLFQSFVVVVCLFFCFFFFLFLEKVSKYFCKFIIQKCSLLYLLAKKINFPLLHNFATVCERRKSNWYQGFPKTKTSSELDLTARWTGKKGNWHPGWEPRKKT